MANLMGFKKVSKMPAPKGRSIYDPLIELVKKTGDMYALDTNDKKRAYSLAATIRNVIKKRGYADVIVSVRDTSVVIYK